MENYSIIREYICLTSKEFYLIKKNDIMYAYDYNHNLIDQTPKIRWIIKPVILSDGTVVFGVSLKKHFFVWDVQKKEINKIKFTKQKYSDVNNLYEKDDYIYIHFHTDKDGKPLEALTSINKINYNIQDTNYDLPTELEYSNQIINSNNSIYYVTFKFINHKLDGYCIYKDNNDSLEEVIYTEYLNDALFKSSKDGKYAFMTGNCKNEPQGKMIIYDFENYQIIDELEFYHVKGYRVIANFLNYNGQEYIVFQKNPHPCTFQNDVWDTCVYSLSEKKIIFEAPFSFSLTNITEKNILILETNYYRKMGLFFEVDDSETLLLDFLEKKVNKRFLRNCLK